MQEYYNTKRRKGKHLTLDERGQILALLRENKTNVYIAKVIGVSTKTIQREKKRGMVEGLRTTELIEYREYSPDKAQSIYNEKQRAKQGELKIGKNIELAKYLEEHIKDLKQSPYVALENAKKAGIEINISLKTIYNYIDKEVFVELRRKDLPYNKKKRYKSRIKNKRIKKIGGKSIESRPVEVNKREELGHWEMDTVVGKRNTKKCLLVLTERKTRKQIIRKIESKTSVSVIKELIKIKDFYPKTFKTRFKSITVDNGSEFMDAEGIEKLGIKDVYYAHSYCSYERGSNENANKLIRRYIPKGTPIEEVTKKEVNAIEKIINTMPRKMFGGKSVNNIYREEWIKMKRKVA